MADEEKWAGLVFDSSLPRGQSDCTLAVRGQRLVARLPSGDALEVDLRRMNHQLGGADGRTHVFTSTSANGATISTGDARVHAAVAKALAGHAPAAGGLSPRQILVLTATGALVLIAVLRACRTR